MSCNDFMAHLGPLEMSCNDRMAHPGPLEMSCNNCMANPGPLEMSCNDSMAHPGPLEMSCNVCMAHFGPVEMSCNDCMAHPGPVEMSCNDCMAHWKCLAMIVWPILAHWKCLAMIVWPILAHWKCLVIVRPSWPAGNVSFSDCMACRLHSHVVVFSLLPYSQYILLTDFSFLVKLVLLQTCNGFSSFWTMIFESKFTHFYTNFPEKWLMTEGIWVFSDNNDEILEAFTLQMVKGEEMDTDLNNSWKMKVGGGGWEERRKTTTLNSLCLYTCSKAPLPPTPFQQVLQRTGKAVVPITQQYHPPVQTVQFYKLW